jgi:hypothetical protein
MLIKTVHKRGSTNVRRTTIYTRATFGDAKNLKDNPELEVVETFKGQLEQVIKEQELGTFTDYR